MLIGLRINDHSALEIPISNGSVVFDIDDNAYVVLWIEKVISSEMAADGPFVLSRRVLFLCCYLKHRFIWVNANYNKRYRRHFLSVNSCFELLKLLLAETQRGKPLSLKLPVIQAT